jgi:uncharacterized lipoprotein YddW (UPF0748 family)
MLMILAGCCSGAAATPKSEFRGAWVTAWASGVLSPDEADETIRAAKEANINALFIQVRKVGDAYYKSNYEHRADNITGPPDYDPLAYIVEKAHAAGIEVHAWLNTFRVWRGPDPPTDPSHIVLRHPDWLTRTEAGVTAASDGLFLDPGVPEVQDYTFKIFMDVIANYDVDGIHLDYVRYPGADFGYAPAAVARFNQETDRTGVPPNDDPAWKQWRRDQVTALVRRIYRGATSMNPRIKVTAATIPWGDCAENFCDTAPFLKVYQDWRLWMERGILDANIPMNYKDERNEQNAREYRNWLDGFKRWQYRRQVYAGLDFNADPELVLRQLDECRKRGLEGMVGFSFNQSEKRPKLVQALKSGPYAQAAPVPQMPWKSSAIRRGSRERYARATDAATRGRDPDRAIVLLKEALNLDPYYADAHFRLGRCYRQKQMYPEAVKEFEDVLAINPNYTAAARELKAARAEMAPRR